MNSFFNQHLPRRYCSDCLKSLKRTIIQSTLFKEGKTHDGIKTDEPGDPVDLTSRQWFSVVGSLIDIRYLSGQNVMDSRAAVDKSTDRAKPPSIYFLPRYRRLIERFFQCVTCCVTRWRASLCVLI